MAVIHSPSPRLMPVRTPLWVSMSPALHDTPATPAQFMLVLVNQPTTGDTVTFTYGAESITLTCVAGILEAHLPPRTFLSAGSNLVQTTLNIANACRRDYTINRDMHVSVIGLQITFTQAATADPEGQYDLSSVLCTPGGWMSGNVLVNGQPGSIVPNHAMRVAIYLENAAQTAFDRLPERSCSIVEGVTPAVNIAGALRTLMEPGLPTFITPFSSLAGIPAPGVFRRFFVEAYEFSGAPAAAGNVQRLGSEDEPLIAWYAGFQQRDPATATDFVQNLQYTTNARQFLSFFGRTGPVKVAKGQYHYVSHYGWSALTGEVPRLEVQVTCTDGTISPWTARYAQAAPYVRRAITLWAVGYQHLLLDSLVPTGKVPASYKVRLRGSVSGIALSEERQYTLVPEDYQEQHLVFLNSVGGYDPVRTTGAWVETGAPTWQSIERPSLLADYGDKEAARAWSVPTGSQRIITLQTTYLPLAEHQCMVDILDSPDIRRVDRVRGRFERVYLASRKEVRLEERGTDDENLYSLELQLIIGAPEEVTTPAVPWPGTDPIGIPGDTGLPE